MNVYLITQDNVSSKGTFDSAVVYAESEQSAVKIHPNGCKESWIDDIFYKTWCKIENVKVELLGEAKPGTKEGVICSSFNAG